MPSPPSTADNLRAAPYNQPIAINMFDCAAVGHSCPKPQVKKPAADLAQVLKDLLALL